MPEVTTMPDALASRLRAAGLTCSEAGRTAGPLPVLVENAAIQFDLGDRDVDDRRSCLFV